MTDDTEVFARQQRTIQNEIDRRSNNPMKVTAVIDYIDAFSEVVANGEEGDVEVSAGNHWMGAVAQVATSIDVDRSTRLAALARARRFAMNVRSRASQETLDDE